MLSNSEKKERHMFPNRAKLDLSGDYFFFFLYGGRLDSCG